MNLLRRNCTPNQNWACFVYHLKVIVTSWKIFQISLSKLSEKLKNNFKLLIDQTIVNQNNVLHILINNSSTSLAYWNFNAIFRFLRRFSSWCLHFIFNKMLINDIRTKHAKCPFMWRFSLRKVERVYHNLGYFFRLHMPHNLWRHLIIVHIFRRHLYIGHSVSNKHRVLTTIQKHTSLVSRECDAKQKSTLKKHLSDRKRLFQQIPFRAKYRV